MLVNTENLTKASEGNKGNFNTTFKRQSGIRPGGR